KTCVNRGLPIRTCVATAPPRKAVTRIAPRTLVRGHTYRRVQISRIAPSLRAMASPANPSCWPASSTGRTAASFIPASMNRNSTTSALIEKPIHHILPRPSISKLRKIADEVRAARSGRLVQIRQLPMFARDSGGGDSDELSQATREMRLVEVVQFGSDLARRQALAQEHDRLPR